MPGATDPLTRDLLSRPRRILVTGAGGFVGSNLVRALAAAGHDVLAHDRVPPDALNRWFLAEHAEHVTHLLGDLTDDTATGLPGEADVDLVVHAAAITSLREADERATAVRIAAVNVVGTARILDWAATGDGTRVLLVGSGRAYGQAPGATVLDEDTPLRPDNLYGTTKAAAEGFALRQGSLHGLLVRVGRIVPPYGPMERPGFGRGATSTVDGWVRAARDGQPLTVAAAPRDYLHIDDVVSGLLAVAGADDLPHQVYNVAPGELAPAEELLAAVRAAFPDRDLSPPAPAPAVRPALDGTRIRRDTGWSPQHTLQTGVAAYASWLDSIPEGIEA